MVVLVRFDEQIPTLHSAQFYMIKFDLIRDHFRKFLISSYQKVQEASNNDEIKKVIKAVVSYITQQPKILQYMNSVYVYKRSILDDACVLYSLSGSDLKEQVSQWISNLQAIFEWFYDRVGHVEFKICNVNFNSRYKRSCSLMEYHDTSLGSGCPYVGFFGSGLDLTAYTTFMSERRKCCFCNTNVFNPQNIGHWSINTREEYFNKDIAKIMNYGLFKLNIAYAKKRETEEIEEIPAIGRVPDEYIIVSNRRIPLCVMNRFESNPDAISEFGFITQFMDSLSTGVWSFKDDIIYDNIVVELCQQDDMCDTDMGDKTNLINLINEFMQDISNDPTFTVS